MAHNNWLPDYKFEQEKFTAWLGEQGAILMRPVGEYELVRYKLRDQLAIVYNKPSKQRVTLGKTAWGHYELFTKGKPVAQKKSKSKHTAPTKPHAKLPDRPTFVLYTDAGNWREQQLGTWAGILLSSTASGFTELSERSGAMARAVNNSTAAEAMAVANSIHRSIADGHLPPRACITVVCDNTAVVRYCGDRKKHKAITARAAAKSKSEGVRDAVAHLADLCERFDLKFRARWVKGHQPKKNTGHDATHNRRCDALCREVKYAQTS